jgi:acetylornithine/succinyldiaminopimelate/putrescine aminotransferase
MFLVGLETMYVMFAPLVNHALGEHRVSGWPFALVAGGVLMPFATKGRLGLEIRTQDKTFRWKPPLVVDKASKRKIQETFDQILAACEKSGLRTSRP